MSAASPESVLATTRRSDPDPDCTAAPNPSGTISAASTSPASMATRAASSLSTWLMVARPTPSIPASGPRRRPCEISVLVQVDIRVPKVERLVAAAQQQAEDGGQAERSDQRDDEDRSVTHPLAEVLRRDADRRARRSEHRSVAQRAAGQVQEDRFEVGLHDLDAADDRAGTGHRFEDARQDAASIIHQRASARPRGRWPRGRRRTLAPRSLPPGAVRWRPARSGLAHR